jgi:DNA polymerase-3 subunit delta
VDIEPESVLQQLAKGQLFPFYLFYGPSEFQLEKVLCKIRDTFIPESLRDLNLEIFYGDETHPSKIIDAAKSLPFMCHSRLIILRRTEAFSPGDLESFVPYLEKPSETTCIIFLSSKPDFKKLFYRRCRELGRAVHFRTLKDNQVVPWIRRIARDMGLAIDGAACAYLQQIIGARLQDLHSELQKLYLRYGEKNVGVQEVKQMAIHSRSYTIFELMDRVSFRDCVEALFVLEKFLGEEDKDGILRVLGMLNRQIGLLWRAKRLVQGGVQPPDVAKQLRLPPFLVNRLIQQSKCWEFDKLENSVPLLCQADDLVKSGSSGGLVLENLVVSLCR